MTKILIVGIGGVGGYFGGMLAKTFHDSKEVSICFMARGEHLKAIKEKGLLVIKGDTRFYAHPDMASDNPSDFGKVDYIILCTKSYDIEETANKIKSCVKTETVFLPLLNGMDSAEKIKTMYPDNLIADGCAHIISRLTAPGKVQNLGNIERIVFGVQDMDDSRLDFLYDIFKRAGVDAKRTKQIPTPIWEKFIFISATATITSYYNKTFGEIKQCEDCCKNLRQLIDECSTVAEHKNIVLPADIREQIWNKFLNLLPETTTSMHSDYLAGKKQTEVHSLTGYIVEQAEKYGIDVPTYREMYLYLIENK
ncbi:MAG: 2-dehydropantoate 2-reductase [Niabella sp.]